MASIYHRWQMQAGLVFTWTLILQLFGSGCATSTVVDLVNNYRPLDAPRCDPFGGVAREPIDAVLAIPSVDDEERKTGVYVLEDGGGALAARGWLTEQAEKSIDIQYFMIRILKL